LTTTVTTTTSTAITIMLMITGTKPGKAARARKGGSRPGPGHGSGPTPRHVDDPAALYRLMTWLSPSFPVGAFSYSSGLEWAVEAGDIVDRPSPQQWAPGMVKRGGGLW